MDHPKDFEITTRRANWDTTQKISKRNEACFINDYIVYLNGFNYTIGQVNEFIAFNEVISSDESNKWIVVDKKNELESTQHNQVCELVCLPEGVKPISCKCVY